MQQGGGMPPGMGMSPGMMGGGGGGGPMPGMGGLDMETMVSSIFYFCCCVVAKYSTRVLLSHARQRIGPDITNTKRCPVPLLVINQMKMAQSMGGMPGMMGGGGGRR